MLLQCLLISLVNREVENKLSHFFAGKNNNNNNG